MMIEYSGSCFSTTSHGIDEASIDARIQTPAENTWRDKLPSIVSKEILLAFSMKDKLLVETMILRQIYCPRFLNDCCVMFTYQVII